MKKNLLVVLFSIVIVSVNAQNSAAQRKQMEQERQDSIAMAQSMARNVAALQARIDSTKLHPETVTVQAGITKTLYFIGGEHDSVAYTPLNAFPTAPTDNLLWAFKSKVGSYTNDVKWLFYMGGNGFKYTTKVVVTTSTDPNKNYEVHFESRKLNEGDYHKGRVILLDYSMKPWLVKVEYSNDRGVYFILSPFVEKQ